MGKLTVNGTWKWIAGSLASVLFIMMNVGMAASWRAEQHQETRLQCVASGLLAEEARSKSVDLAVERRLERIENKIDLLLGSRP